MTIDYLLLDRKLGILTQERQDALLTVSGEKLTAPDQMKRFLEFYQKQIKGLDIQVASTYFAASWRTVCAAMLYMFSLTDGGLDFSLENLTIQVAQVNKSTCILFVLKKSRESVWPEEDRSLRREQALGTFCLNTLRPMLVAAAAESGLPVTHLWGQLPLGIDHYADHVAGELADHIHRRLLREDCEYLMKSLPAAWFGLKRNPFDIKEIWLENPRRPGGKRRMKPACCLAYRTDSDHGYCYGCPKLSEEAREAKRAKLAATNANFQK